MRVGDLQEKGKVLVTFEPDVAGFIEISVSDNGKGFPNEDRRRLTEPYVTTRAEGTGLGLPIVVKIFEDHGGGVDLLDGLARTDGGRGAMVLMKLLAPGAGQSNPEAAQERSDRLDGC